jgi:hypothetical protein
MYISRVPVLRCIGFKTFKRRNKEEELGENYLMIVSVFVYVIHVFVNWYTYAVNLENGCL